MSLINWKAQDELLKREGGTLKDKKLSKISKAAETSDSPKKTSTLFGRLLKLMSRKQSKEG